MNAHETCDPEDGCAAPACVAAAQNDVRRVHANEADIKNEIENAQKAAEHVIDAMTIDDIDEVRLELCRALGHLRNIERNLGGMVQS